MPVMSKKDHAKYHAALEARFSALLAAFEARELTSNGEGTKSHATWVRPEQMCATKGSTMDLSLAVEDFKTILAEVKKLK